MRVRRNYDASSYHYVPTCIMSEQKFCIFITRKDNAFSFINVDVGLYIIYIYQNNKTQSNLDGEETCDTCTLLSQCCFQFYQGKSLQLMIKLRKFAPLFKRLKLENLNSSQQDILSFREKKLNIDFRYRIFIVDPKDYDYLLGQISSDTRID